MFEAGADMFLSVLLLGSALGPGLGLGLVPELELELELELSPAPGVGLVPVPLARNPALSRAVAVLVLGLLCKLGELLTMRLCWIRIACSICSCVN
jgi:hypothetical protein